MSAIILSPPRYYLSVFGINGFLIVWMMHTYGHKVYTHIVSTLFKKKKDKIIYK